MLVILPASAFAQDAAEDTFAGHDIFFTVSGGLVSAPSFLGSSETSVYALPNISVSIGDRLNSITKHKTWTHKKISTLRFSETLGLR